MTSRTRIIIGISLSLIVIVAALLLIGYFLVTKSLPPSSGTLVAQGLTQPVEVYSDSFGMPHVFAANDHDAYFAAGYLHARDRLWQMELIRRAGQGRLAEILGENALPVDKLFRTLDLTSVAKEIVGGVEGETRSALEDYAAGVNSFIESHRSKLPVEFDMLGFEPEDWLPEHSILISKLMAWELNFSRWVDITYGYIVERVGEARARDLYPDWSSRAPVIVPKELRGREVASLGRQLLDADLAFRTFTGLGGFGSGSNAWVIAGKKSVTGKPLLANDPHLTLTAPARWYEMHLSTPTQDVSGTSLPGIPFIVIGRNRSAAWGMTNAMLDDEDFYVEQVDSLEFPSRYRLNGGWREIERHVDTILVKDHLPVEYTSYRTHRGPVVNRIEPAAAMSQNLLSMRWVGFNVSHETEAFYRINRANNWKEFRAAVRLFSVPAQNFLYADTAGTIAYCTGGAIPIRKHNGFASPYPGWTDEYDWKGWVPFEENPHAVNPERGFLATANNKIADDSYPYYLSNHWEPEWRIDRIDEVLSQPGTLAKEDLQRLQLDVVSPQARMLVPQILKAFPDTTVENEDIRIALSYFRSWNYAMREENVATTVFESFILRAIRNTFEDELGPSIARLYDTLAVRPLIAISNLLLKDSSEWFDDVRTPETERKTDIIRKSLMEGIEDLRQRYGGTLKEWNWGGVHQVEFKHVFGGNSLLRSLFNVGPFSVGGSHSTVWKGDFFIGNPFQNTVGPSTRQIFDLSDPNDTRAVTPPGQSGQIFHKNYDDQVPLWRAGAYRIVPMDRAKILQAGYQLLRLVPSE